MQEKSKNTDIESIMNMWKTASDPAKRFMECMVCEAGGTVHPSGMTSEEAHALLSPEDVVSMQRGGEVLPVEEPTIH